MRRWAEGAVLDAAVCDAAGAAGRLPRGALRVPMSALLPNTSANATATAIVDTSGDLLWVEIVLLALVILATVVRTEEESTPRLLHTASLKGHVRVPCSQNVVFLCASGNLLTWKDKDHEDMQCRPQCGLSIFPKLGKRLVRAAQVADKYTTQEAAKGVVVAATLLTNLAAQLKKAMLCKAEGTLAKACYAPRRQFSVEIRTLLDDITLPARSKAIATAEEKGAESDEAVRATDEADTLDSICTRSRCLSNLGQHAPLSPTRISSRVPQAMLPTPQLPKYWWRRPTGRRSTSRQYVFGRSRRRFGFRASGIRSVPSPSSLLPMRCSPSCPPRSLGVSLRRPTCAPWSRTFGGACYRGLWTTRASHPSSAVSSTASSTRRLSSRSTLSGCASSS